MNVFGVGRKFYILVFSISLGILTSCSEFSNSDVEGKKIAFMESVATLSSAKELLVECGSKLKTVETCRNEAKTYLLSKSEGKKLTYFVKNGDLYGVDFRNDLFVMLRQKNSDSWECYGWPDYALAKACRSVSDNK